MKKLNNFWGGRSSRGDCWHYFDSVMGVNAPKKGSKYSIPEDMRMGILEGYESICAVRSTAVKGEGGWSDSLYICAIPEKGGDYRILKFKATQDEVSKIRTREGLQELVESVAIQ